MSTRDAAVPLDELLAHRAWVRSLALALTRDEHEADDVVQETWLTALRSPPRHAGSVRGWLGAVARTAVGRRARSEGRLRRREAAAARPELSGARSPAELAARADIHARVATAVVALREPYRETILLRYFEGLGIGEVSARMRAPNETTRARLRRGRQLLRERLRRDVGGEKALGAALVPLLAPDAGRWGSTSGAAVAAGGAVAMSKVVMGSVGLCALAALALWITSEDEPVVPTPDVSSAEEASAPALAPAPEPARRQRERVAEEPTVEDAATPSDTEPEAAPRPGAAVLLEKRLAEVRYNDDPLDRVLARISGQTGLAIHVESDLVAKFGSDEFAINLRLDSETSVKQVLTLLVTFRGLALHVEEERVVVHDAATEWRAGMATVAIEPEAPDPDAPTSLRVRGRVVDESGGGIASAALLHGKEEVGRSGPGGHFEVEVRKQFQALSARIPGRQRSAEFRVEGEYGDTLETEFVVGPAAGSVRIDVVSSKGGLPDAGRVILKWDIPGTETTLRDGRRVARVETELFYLGGETGVERVLHESVPPGDVRVTVTGNEHVKDERTIVVAEGMRTDVQIELRHADLATRLREERVSFTFEDADVHTIVRYLRNTRAFRLIVAPELAPRILGEPVSLTATDETLERALDDLCSAMGGVKWEIEREIVFLRPVE